MPRLLVKLLSSVALLGAGALGGAAMTARPVPVPAPATAAVPKPRVEVRTIVKRRTVHVYRRPKRRPARPSPAAPEQAPAATPAPPPPASVAPAPVPVVHPVTPVAQRPLETRTSGGPAGGDDRGEHEGGEEHESEGGDD